MKVFRFFPNPELRPPDLDGVEQLHAKLRIGQSTEDAHRVFESLMATLDFANTDDPLEYHQLVPGPMSDTQRALIRALVRQRREQIDTECTEIGVELAESEPADGWDHE